MTRICAYLSCQKEFTLYPNKGGRTGKLYCCPRCRWKASVLKNKDKIARQRRARHKSKKGKKQGLCKECGNPFVLVQRIRIKYCSERCKALSRKKQNKECAKKRMPKILAWQKKWYKKNSKRLWEKEKQRRIADVAYHNHRKQLARDFYRRNKRRILLEQRRYKEKVCRRLFSASDIIAEVQLIERMNQHGQGE